MVSCQENDIVCVYRQCAKISIWFNNSCISVYYPSRNPGMNLCRITRVAFCVSEVTHLSLTVWATFLWMHAALASVAGSCCRAFLRLMSRRKKWFVPVPVPVAATFSTASPCTHQTRHMKWQKSFFGSHTGQHWGTIRIVHNLLSSTWRALDLCFFVHGTPEKRCTHTSRCIKSICQNYLDTLFWWINMWFNTLTFTSVLAWMLHWSLLRNVCLQFPQICVFFCFSLQLAKWSTSSLPEQL